MKNTKDISFTVTFPINFVFQTVSDFQSPCINRLYTNREPNLEQRVKKSRLASNTNRLLLWHDATAGQVLAHVSLLACHRVLKYLRLHTRTQAGNCRLTSESETMVEEGRRPESRAVVSAQSWCLRPKYHDVGTKTQGSDLGRRQSQRMSVNRIDFVLPKHSKCKKTSKTGFLLS